MYDVKKKSWVQRFREWLDPIPEPEKQVFLGTGRHNMKVFVNGHQLSGVQKVSMNIKLTPLEADVEQPPIPSIDLPTIWEIRQGNCHPIMKENNDD